MITAEQIYDEYVSGDRDKVAAVLADQPPLVCAKVCLDMYRFLSMEHRQGRRTVAVPAGFVDWLGRQAEPKTEAVASRSRLKTALAHKAEVWMATANSWLDSGLSPKGVFRSCSREVMAILKEYG